MGIEQHGPVLDDFDAGLGEGSAIGGFEAGNFTVFVGDQRRPVERGMRHGPAEAGGVLKLAVKARRIDQKLLRHAATDDAGAAEAIFLRDHDARAMLGGNARGAHPARPASNDEKIDLVIGHNILSHHISWPRFFISSRMLPMTSWDRLSPHAPALDMA